MGTSPVASKQRLMTSAMKEKTVTEVRCCNISRNIATLMLDAASFQTFLKKRKRMPSKNFKITKQQTSQNKSGVKVSKK